MQTEESQHIVIAALMLALALVCEAYRLLDEDDQEDVVEVSGGVVVVEATPVESEEA